MGTHLTIQIILLEKNCYNYTIIIHVPRSETTKINILKLWMCYLIICTDKSVL